MAGIKRINRGRGHSYTIDGQYAVGVTTAMDVLGKPALINWAANTAANYAVDHWDDLAPLPPSKRLEQIKGARFADVDQASRRGTEVHALAEKLVQGLEVDVPLELAGHIESTVRFLDEWEPEPILTETVVASRKWMYCGTTDGVMRLRDGRVVIYDFKTSRSGIYAESALQLAAYAHAEHYIDAEGDEQPMADLDIVEGWGIHIRADGYTPYPLEISETVFKDFLHILWCWRMRNERMDGWKGEALTPPAKKDVA